MHSLLIYKENNWKIWLTAQPDNAYANVSDVKREYKSAEAFIGADNRVLQEQVNELDMAYVRSQRYVFELSEALRKQKKLLDRISKEVLLSLETKFYNNQR